MHVIRRGKHMYGQKPLSLTVEEQRRMADAVAKAGVTFQTGSQQRCSQHFRIACEFIRNGRICPVQTVKIGFAEGHPHWSGLATCDTPETQPK